MVTDSIQFLHLMEATHPSNHLVGLPLVILSMRSTVVLTQGFSPGYAVLLVTSRAAVCAIMRCAEAGVSCFGNSLRSRAANNM